MKTISKVKYAALFCMALCLGCSKDSTDGDSKNNTMQAKVDGAFIVCNAYARVSKDLSGNLWGLEGTDTEGHGFKFLFPISKGVRSYQFLGWDDTFQNEGWFFDIGGEQFKSTGGSITITVATNHRFEGTFSFPSESYEGNSRQVTEGEFKIDY